MGIRCAALALALVLAPARGWAQKPVADEPDTARISPAMIEAGRSIFHSRGSCFACHGQKMEGTQLAPTLIKKEWKDAKGGELKNIFFIVTHGVAGTLMVAFPGAISRTDAANVASYVWSVNHRGEKP
jgi:mono/diheme cytochrome c family protein